MTNDTTNQKEYMLRWLKRNLACKAGSEWADLHCGSLDEAWLAAPHGIWVVWLALRPGVLDDATLERFVDWCLRRARAAPSGTRSRRVVDEADQPAGRETVLVARDVAHASARAAAYDAACDAACGARDEIVCEISHDASCDVYDGDRDNARDDDFGAVYDAAYDAATAEYDAQAEWLRRHAKPRWGGR